MHKTLIQSICALAILPVAAMAQTVPLTQDTYVVPGSGINYGTATTINVGGPTAAEALVQFDLTALPSGIKGSNVAKATLTLFVNKLGAAGTVNISMANGPWAETAVSGTGATPGPGAAVASGVSVAVGSDYLYVDATAAVQAWLNGMVNNNGFIITPAAGGVNIGFDSKESVTTSHPATLSVLIQSVGPAGPTGATGGQGLAGAIGAIGPQGPIGLTGPAGPTTLASICGTLFSSITNPRQQMVTCESVLGFAKIMFVTESTTSGNIGGVAGANAMCAKEATAAGLTGTFLAWISDGVTSPSTTFVHSLVPYVRPDSAGTVIAPSWAALTNGSGNPLINPVYSDAMGNVPTSPLEVWTGVNADGSPAASNCNRWTNGNTLGGTIGIWEFTSSGWTNQVTDSTCYQTYPIYCVQQ